MYYADLDTNSVDKIADTSSQAVLDLKGDLSEVNRQVTSCRKCALWKTRNRPVFGERALVSDDAVLIVQEEECRIGQSIF